MLRRKTPLKAKTGFKKRSGKLKAVSDSRKIKNKEYSEVRKNYLEKIQGKCEVCGGEAADIHHKSKRGKNLSVPSTFLAVCRPCHTLIHDNPAWARENNYLIYDYK
jgi:hypothetical protein